MELVEFIRQTWPHTYWSAGFIAGLIVVMGVSTVLYMITRWRGWILTCLAAALYVVPFFFHFK